MRSIGRYEGATRNLSGELVVSFVINDETELEKLEKDKEKDLVIESKRFNEKRSLSANGYFWKLCSLIAEKLKTTKEAVYFMELRDGGVWTDVTVKKKALPMIRKQFRYIEEFFEDTLGEEDLGEDDPVTVRCYIGSSHYDKAEMSKIIDAAVREAKGLGIDTWTPEEIAVSLAFWEGEQR